jgi:serine/threonine-protein kinase
MGTGTGAALAGDTVYTGGSTGYVHAFDAATGAKRWTVKISSDSEMPTLLSVGDGTVYVGANRFGAQSTGHLFALRESDGKLITRLNLDLFDEGPIAVRGAP